MKQLLESARNIKSQNKNFSIPIDLVSSRNEFPICDIQKTIDDAERYYVEKNKSCCYKVQGSITPIVSNELIQITNASSLQSITEFAFENNIDDYTTIIKKEDGWNYYLLDDCTKKFFEPSKERFDLSDKSKWCVDVYIESECNNDFIVNGIPLSIGISIFKLDVVKLDNRNVTIFYTLHPHNLNINSEIRIGSIGSNTNYNNKFTVKKIGDQLGNSKKNAFIVEVVDDVQPDDLYLVRSVNDVDSKYYLRKVKKLNSTKTDIFKLPFSQSVFGDTNLGFNIRDIDICNMNDCFSKPLSKAYIGIIKNNINEVDYNGSRYFGRVQSGFDFLDNNVNYDITSINYNNKIQPLENNVTCEQGEYILDIFEYNSYEIKEYSLGAVKHRFNSLDRYENDYLEGYCYTPFHSFQVRNYSSYVEQGTTENVDGIPDYAEPYGESFRWRDLLDWDFADIGESNIEYPFVNGCHHVSTNIQLCINRQDVCNIVSEGTLNPIVGDCIDIEPVDNMVEDPC